MSIKRHEILNRSSMFYNFHFEKQKKSQNIISFQMKNIRNWKYGYQMTQETL